MEKKNENGKVQLKGQLKLYIQWPAIMGLLLIAMNLWVYKMDHRAGILMAVFVLIYIIMVGGAPVNQSFADQIGADYYTPDAATAAEVAKKAVTEK